MDYFDEKIQAVRHICKQLEELDAMLVKLKNSSMIEEYRGERNKQLERLKQLLK